jgi:hypothetical protein
MGRAFSIANAVWSAHEIGLCRCYSDAHRAILAVV